MAFQIHEEFAALHVSDLQLPLDGAHDNLTSCEVGITRNELLRQGQPRIVLDFGNDFAGLQIDNRDVMIAPNGDCHHPVPICDMVRADIEVRLHAPHAWRCRGGMIDGPQHDHSVATACGCPSALCAEKRLILIWNAPLPRMGGGKHLLHVLLNYMKDRPIDALFDEHRGRTTPMRLRLPIPRDEEFDIGLGQELVPAIQYLLFLRVVYDPHFLEFLLSEDPETRANHDA
eukprot:CAMPEP_0115537654 /NCGR_PEP_ID=MMETSP0271-20121206/88446_1 /TAXON_ID=71861 /ORGANISM="Scrippsiella trochoidea, Strain CCMP3099" /LENGTH=229 /DNA_ID=CAMNT_0002970469 /DNA_START=474 /DNA_END=1160 /DNA_ORIENTATION=+